MELPGRSSRRGRERIMDVVRDNRIRQEKMMYTSATCSISFFERKKLATHLKTTHGLKNLETLKCVGNVKEMLGKNYIFSEDHFTLNRLWQDMWLFVAACQIPHLTLKKTPLSSVLLKAYRESVE